MLFKLDDSLQLEFECASLTFLYAGCIKMIGAVLKLIIFRSMGNEILNTSRNEIVTQQVYDTYLSLLNCRRNAR